MVNGEISWKNPPHKFNNDKDIFLKLQEGKNKVRFVTNPFAFYIHEYQPTGAKFASKVRCSKSEPNDTCVFCDGVVKSDPKYKVAPKTANRKARYYAGVIDRRTNSVKVLEFNSMIFDTIESTQDDEDWGPIIGYDFNIKKDSNSPTPMNFYTATPSTKGPLSAEEQELVDNFDKQVIINLSKVHSVDKVAASIERVKEYARNDKNKDVKKYDESKSDSSSEDSSSSDSNSSEDDDGEGFLDYKPKG